MTSTVAGPVARPDTREMIVVHNTFRRLFGDLAYVIGGVAAGDATRAAVVADIYSQLAAGLQHHHADEDELLWPVLLQRVPTDSALVLRAEEQHERVHEVVERGRAQAGRWRVAGDPQLRDDFAATVTELHDVLCDHLTDEETQLLPLVETYLTVAEWTALRDRAAAVTPKDRRLIHLGWLLDGLDAQDRRELLRKVPVTARVAWRLVGRRRWRQERDRFYDVGSAQPGVIE